MDILLPEWVFKLQHCLSHGIPGSSSLRKYYDCMNSKKHLSQCCKWRATCTLDTNGTFCQQCRLYQVQVNWANTGKLSLSVTFNQYFKVFHVNFNICFPHLVLLEMISFEKIYLKLSYRRLQYDASNFVQSICPPFSQTSDGFLKLCRRRLIRYNSST